MKSKFTLPTLLLIAVTAISYQVFTSSQLQTQNPSTVEELFAGGLSNSLPDRPNARAEWEFNRLKNPKTGQIPEGIKGKEQMFLKKLNAKKAAKTTKSAVEDLEWVPRGPFNISGRTRAFAMDVRDENVLFAGSPSGGLWRS
ncbi:MAG: hypothetical protein AB8B69_02910, partial [Chitinophagales bacterium]